MANPLAGKKGISITVAGVIGFLTLVVQYPPIAAYLSGLLGAHPQIAAAIAGVGSIIALFHDPNAGHTS